MSLGVWSGTLTYSCEPAFLKVRVERQPAAKVDNVVSAWGQTKDSGDPV